MIIAVDESEAALEELRGKRAGPPSLLEVAITAEDPDVDRLSGLTMAGQMKWLSELWNQEMTSRFTRLTGFHG